MRLPEDPADWPQGLREELEERVSIMIDGDLSREKKATREAIERIRQRELHRELEAALNDSLLP